MAHEVDDGASEGGGVDWAAFHSRCGGADRRQPSTWARPSDPIVSIAAWRRMLDRILDGLDGGSPMRCRVVSTWMLWLAGTIVLAVPLGPAGAQGLPGRSANAKACAFLPIADLEAHFGAKATNLGGMDQSTRATCSASFPDPSHLALVESHPPSAADLAMTATSRLAFVREAMGTEVLDTKDFGSVGCFRTMVKVPKPTHVTTCFLANAAYLALSVQSVDAAQASYDAVRSLLEKAAARRK